jgi:capsular exopolysaccharide synthesis family protein
VPHHDDGFIIGITSSLPQEGKSFTTLQLAYSFAEGGYKVMVIDGDMRKSSIAKNLDEPSSPGLSNLLVEEDSNVIRKKILHENLDFIFAGDIPPNPAELCGCERMGIILDFFRKYYDYIFIDLPPVGVVPDPLIISKYIGGMLVIVRHNKTRKREIIDTMRQLKQINAKVLGFVYNAYTRQNVSYKKYRNYY